VPGLGMSTFLELRLGEVRGWRDTLHGRAPIGQDRRRGMIISSGIMRPPQGSWIRTSENFPFHVLCE
jgi:hypothetical protein